MTRPFSLNREQVDTLVRLWGTGASLSQIGMALGVSKGTVSGQVARLRANGVDLPPRLQEADEDGLIVRLWQAGATLAEIVAALGRPKAYVTTRMYRMRQRGVDLPLRCMPLDEDADFDDEDDDPPADWPARACLAHLQDLRAAFGDRPPPDVAVRPGRAGVTVRTLAVMLP